MKALSVTPVWAWAIIHAGKNVENRSWRTHYRGPVAIHASKTLTRREYAEAKQALPRRAQKALPAFEDLPKGAILGVVELTDCVTESKSPWFGGAYGFVLKRPRAIKPLSCTGALGFWKVPPAIERKLKRVP